MIEIMNSSVGTDHLTLFHPEIEHLLHETKIRLDILFT